MRILVVEDEKKLSDIIETSLKKEKYSVDTAYDGLDGSYKALSGIYNLIILDIMLPEKDGYQILKEIRENNIDSKVIMLTAKSQLEDKLIGFNNGADDYITKPFHIEELLARVNVQLRKNNNRKITEYIEFGDLKLNLKKSNLLCTTTNENIDFNGYKLYVNNKAIN